MTPRIRRVPDALLIAASVVFVVLAFPVLAAGALVGQALLLLLLVAIPVVVATALLSPRLRTRLSLMSTPEVAYKGLRLATDVRLASAHSWARVELGKATVGVDDMAQSILGPVARVELPAPGAHVERGAPLFRLLRDGRVLVARAPMTGEVEAVNGRLLDEPELVNTAPYGAGWAVRLRDHGFRQQRRDLLSGVEARDWFRFEVDRLIGELSPASVAATLPDGGLVSAELYRYIEPEQWARLNTSFFDGDDLEQGGLDAGEVVL